LLLPLLYKLSPKLRIHQQVLKPNT